MSGVSSSIREPEAQNWKWDRPPPFASDWWHRSVVGHRRQSCAACRSGDLRTTRGAADFPESAPESFRNLDRSPRQLLAWYSFKPGDPADISTLRALRRLHQRPERLMANPAPGPSPPVENYVTAFTEFVKRATPLVVGRAQRYLDVLAPVAAELRQCLGGVDLLHIAGVTGSGNSYTSLIAWAFAPSTRPQARPGVTAALVPALRHADGRAGVAPSRRSRAVRHRRGCPRYRHVPRWRRRRRRGEDRFARAHYPGQEAPRKRRATRPRSAGRWNSLETRRSCF